MLNKEHASPAENGLARIARSLRAVRSPTRRFRPVTQPPTILPASETPQSLTSSLGKRASGAAASRGRPRAKASVPAPAMGPTSSASSISQACWDICSNDPRVKGPAALTASGSPITSAVSDAVMRRWEMAKLVELLPTSALLRACGLHETAAPRDNHQMAQYLFAKAQDAHPSTIANARRHLKRLLEFLRASNISWDGSFGRLTELDAFAYLMHVHNTAVTNGTEARPGFCAIWGAYGGLTFLNTHLRLQFPLHAVRPALPRRAVKTGPGAILNGALPLPPEALEDLCRYIIDPHTPPVMRSWAHALAFSAFSSLRQANAQHLTFYGYIQVDGLDFLVSHHTDGKSRDKMPVVFVTPLQDFSGSSRWHHIGKEHLYEAGDFLWAACTGDPLSQNSRPEPRPLEPERILPAMHLVLQHACSMSPEVSRLYSQQSARKTLVSAAQAAGCPWEQCVELGHWGPRSLDSSFLLSDAARHKHALACMPMPKRYAANARLWRVARIVGNQMRRLREYLRHRRSITGPTRWDTRWDLMPPYNACSEGT